MPLKKLVDELYEKRPSGVLYHYASLGSAIKIIESRSLWATDIRYFNDTAELNHTATLLRAEIAKRLAQHGCDSNLLTQFESWLTHRITDGHMQFVTCFTENGNLLSQWRGYCPPSRGISLGFSAQSLVESAKNQQFSIGKCLYSLERQKGLVAHLIESIESLAKLEGENTDTSKRHPMNSFFDVFEKVETDLLKIAALIKHPSFYEEQEWRAISPVLENYVASPIEYREGTSMLVPFIRFTLPSAIDRQIDIDNVYIGPTPHINNSVNSLSNYLSKSRASPRNGVSYCQIPYRAW